MSTTEEPPEQAEDSPDEWLEKRLRETRAMAGMVKRNAVIATREDANPPPPDELLALDRLEVKIANRLRIARVRALTRGRRATTR